MHNVEHANYMQDYCLWILSFPLYLWVMITQMELEMLHVVRILSENTGESCSVWAAMETSFR